MSEDQKEFKVTDKRGEVAEDAKKEAPSKQEVTDDPSQYPPINFTSFVLSVSTSALVQMGLVPDPLTKSTQKNMILAKQQVDIIEMLGEKSKGNLDEKEQKLMDQVLYELRMRYMEVQKNDSV